jgi:hypothetical protein
MFGNQEVEMNTNKFLKAGWVLLVVLALLAFHPIMAGAQAPGNDDIANATVISALPYSDTLDTSEATAASSDPFSQCIYNTLQATVWYVYTPLQDVMLEASTAGSSYNTVLEIFNGPPEYNSSFACATNGVPVLAHLNANTTYYFLIGANPAYPPPSQIWGGTLVFNLSQAAAPANDNFTDAKIVEAIPYSDAANNIATSREVNEPIASCTPYYLSPGGSQWYVYSPTSTETLSAQVNGYDVPDVLAVYQGNNFQNLVEKGCSDYGGVVSVRFEAGQTYYFQISKLYDYEYGTFTFSIFPTPPPEVTFFYYPGDPSRFDTVDFYDNSGDPGGVGIQTEEWNFGDGSTGTGCCPTHQYSADGDYTVTLAVTTYDGRSASASQPLSVRTHDVAITRFNTPQSAKAGQTRTITVGVNNKSNAETVEVQLFRSVPGGWVYFASLTQYVPPRNANRTTDFSFSYTFTPQDAGYGKVSFRAVANIQNARDAFPADNEAISSPVKVSR